MVENLHFLLDVFGGHADEAGSNLRGRRREHVLHRKAEAKGRAGEALA